MPTRANRKPAPPLLLGTCAVLLAACSGASPAPSPTTSLRTPVAVATSPSATPVPTPTLPEPAPSPTPPPEMARADEAGAVAAVTYFLTDLYRYTVTSQDTSAWLAMSHDECVYCRSTADAIVAERESNVVTTPGDLMVIDTRVDSPASLVFGVQLDVEIGPSVQHARSGEALAGIQGGQATMAAIVMWHSNRWLVRGVDVMNLERDD